MLKELGKWGMQQAYDEMDPGELNHSALVRDFAVALRLDQLPTGDTSIQFTITGDGPVAKQFVLVRNGTTQVCDENLGTEVDVYLTADLATFGRIWYGELAPAAACDRGLLKVVGNSFYTSKLSRWLGISELAVFNPRVG